MATGSDQVGDTPETTTGGAAEHNESEHAGDIERDVVSVPADGPGGVGPGVRRRRLPRYQAEDRHDRTGT